LKDNMRASLPTAKELLARLVAFDTTSHKTNIPLIQFVEGYLAGHGIESVRVPTQDGAKSSLFATIGPADVPGVALSGHTDVVPVAGQVWDTDPFSLTERDGKLYGRGSCDMKGYLACALALVPLLKARKLKVPFHLAFSYDEEVGCTGVRPMIGEFGKTLPVPRYVFVGEPTGMTVVDAHKGPVRWRVELNGRAAHSSMPHLGVNAIAYAGLLIAELARMEQELRGGVRDERFDPPWTSLQVTQIEGGTASNIVPVPCWFGWEIRGLPGFDPMTLDARLRRLAETCRTEMRRVAPEADIRIQVANRVPAFGADTRSGIVPLALQIGQQNETFAVSYCTEAGLFQDGGAPAVVVGPGHIAQAHTVNEFIAVDELAKCLGFLERLADWAEA
jgi:acetylornithine deacetylase